MRLQSMLLSSQILANSLNCLTSSIHKTPCKTAVDQLSEKLQLLDIDVHWIVGEVKRNGAIDSGPKTKNLFNGRFFRQPLDYFYQKCSLDQGWFCSTFIEDYERRSKKEVY